MRLDNLVIAILLFLAILYIGHIFGGFLAFCSFGGLILGMISGGIKSNI